MAVHDLDRDRAKSATARAFPTNSGTNVEDRAVGCADQAIFAHQKLARRVVEPTPGMCADVVIGESAFAATQDNKIHGLAVAAGIDGDSAAVTDRIESTQCGWRLV